MNIGRWVGLCLFFSLNMLAAAEGPPAITPEELKMTTEPLAAGAPAITLYRQVDRDDTGQTAHEVNFVRIKVLKDEGRN